MRARARACARACARARVRACARTRSVAFGSSRFPPAGGVRARGRDQVSMRGAHPHPRPLHYAQCILAPAVGQPGRQTALHCEQC